MRYRYKHVLTTMVAILFGLPLAIVAQSKLPSSVFNWDSIKVMPTKTGERRPFFQSPTATLEELECHSTTLNPGELSHPPHQHPEEELIIVKEGTVEVLVNGELKRVGPGSVIFQAPNQLHSIRNVGNTPAIYHAIRWRSFKKGKLLLQDSR